MAIITFFLILIVILFLVITSDDVSEAFIKGGAALLVAVLTGIFCWQVEKETNYVNSIIQKYKKGEYTMEIRVDKEKVDTIYIVNFNDY